MSSCVPCVRHTRVLLGRQTRWKRRKDVRHRAAVGVPGFVLSVGSRRHGEERDLVPAGEPGAGAGQLDRYVPRGRGVDGGHSAHTGGGSGPGWRHILSIHIKPVLTGREIQCVHIKVNTQQFY